MSKLSFILISTLMALMLVAACSSPGPRRGGREDSARWAITDSADLATGLWHGQADCRFGPLSNDEVLVGLRSSNNRYDAYIARIPRTRPAIVSWRATGQVDSAGNLVLLPDLLKKQLLSYARPVTVLINDSLDDKLVMKAGDITQRGNPASRCQPIALRRVSDGKASDFLVDGRLSNVDALTATRLLTGMRNDLGGLWEGSMVCRDRIEPVRIRINQADNGGWTSTFRFGTRPAIDYGLEPVPNSVGVAYRFTSDDKYQLRRNGTLGQFNGDDLIQKDGRATWLRIGGGASCEDATVYRYEVVPGLGGAYADADGFLDMCNVIASTWLAGLAQEREAGKSLKVELSRSLSNYDPERASRAIVTDPERLAGVFSLPVNRWSEDQFQALSQQIAQCATIGEDGVRDTIRRGLFAERALNPIGGATRKYARWNPLANVTMIYSLQQLQQPRSRHSAELSHIQTSSLSTTSASEAETLLSRAVPELESLPPSVVLSALHRSLITSGRCVSQR